MSVGERQRVEIVRCLLQAPRLLIMDEPTSVLTPLAVQRLFETLRQLAAEGCSILYISHKLDEIRALCETATVLRSGKVTARSLSYQAMNVVGAAGFIVNGWWHGAIPSTALNIIWLLIGGFASWRIVQTGASSTSAM